MKVLLLLSAAAALTAPTIAPPSVLDGLAQLAQVRSNHCGTHALTFEDVAPLGCA